MPALQNPSRLRILRPQGQSKTAARSGAFESAILPALSIPEDKPSWCPLTRFLGPPHPGSSLRLLLCPVGEPKELAKYRANTALQCSLEFPSVVNQKTHKQKSGRVRVGFGRNGPEPAL